MATRLCVIAAYFTALLLIGFLARMRHRGDPSEYFLAGRTMGTGVLMATMAATNFSAFTVFGVSGAGYRDGFAFLPIMAFGTGFMALNFWLVGRKVRELGAAHGLITPSELMRHLYNNTAVARVTALVLLVFTVPYIALQPLAAGTVVNQLFGTPEWVGATIVTGAIVLYTLRGGMRAVAWTDLLQGALLLGLMLVALAMIVNHHGGWSTALSEVATQKPALFSRPGLQGTYTPAIWFSFLALWFFCDPMFPQLFQRFYAAKSTRVLGRLTLWYPAICLAVFAPPVLVGVLGHLHFPALTASEADGVFAAVMMAIGGDVTGTLVLVAGLTALMSSMDSQLLTLSSIVSRDLWPAVAKGQTASVSVARMIVVVLAVLGLLVALTTDATILDLGVTAFTGFAVLFPSVLLGLYLRQPRAVAALTSIIAGEAMVIAMHAGVIPTFGFLSAIPAIACATAVYLLIHVLTGPVHLPSISLSRIHYVLFFPAIFLLAQDYWRWGNTGTIILGVPGWCWYFAGLSAAQMLITALMMRDKAAAAGDR
ncbi:MAG: sodium:solute symporter family protein [Chloroflexota bacterium]